MMIYLILKNNFPIMKVVADLVTGNREQETSFSGVKVVLGDCMRCNHKFYNSSAIGGALVFEWEEVFAALRKHTHSVLIMSAVWKRQICICCVVECQKNCEFAPLHRKSSCYELTSYLIR